METQSGHNCYVVYIIWRHSPCSVPVIDAGCESWSWDNRIKANQQIVSLAPTRTVGETFIHYQENNRGSFTTDRLWQEVCGALRFDANGEQTETRTTFSLLISIQQVKLAHHRLFETLTSDRRSVQPSAFWPDEVWCEASQTWTKTHFWGFPKCELVRVYSPIRKHRWCCSWAECYIREGSWTLRTFRLSSELLPFFWTFTRYHLQSTVALSIFFLICFVLISASCYWWIRMHNISALISKTGPI